MMNSFDVFDTLVGRRTVTNDSILWTISETDELFTKTHRERFVRKRKEADTGTRNLYEIYEELAKQGVIDVKDVDAFVRREIDLEISISFPITKNMKRVRDGDVLISDMYLPAYAILDIVRACGLDKQVTLYQSNSGKSSGSVWKYIKPDLHLGDNIHSDVNMPRAAGIQAEHFDNPHTPIASCINYLTREVKLRLEEGGKWGELAAQFNVPFLLFLSQYLYQNYGDREIVFLGRDCYLLHKIYTAYFQTAHYVPFSRKLAYADAKKAIHYLETHSPRNPLYFDLSSTGATWEHLAKVKDLDVLVLYYSDLFFYTKDKPFLPDNFKYILKNSEVGQTNEMLEFMNCAPHGSIGSVELFDERLMQATFLKNDCFDSWVEQVIEPVLLAQQLAPHYKGWIRTELALLTDDELKSLIHTMATEMCSRIGEL